MVSGVGTSIDREAETPYQFDTMSQVDPDRIGKRRGASVEETAGVRERNVEERRRRILEAARMLLVKGGLGALSMRKLADEASLSVNTLYNLWGTREEILRALTLDARERIDARLPSEEQAEDPIAYIRSLVRVSVREMMKEQDLFRPMILAWLEGEIAGHPSPIEPMYHSIRGLSKAIRIGRDEGILEGPIQPEHVASQIHHGAQFAAIQWALRRIDDAHFEARALYGLNLALLGIVRKDRRPEIRTALKRLERKLWDSRPDWSR